LLQTNGTINRFFGAAEKDMNIYVHSGTMKIVKVRESPASGPLFRHGGARRF